MIIGSPDETNTFDFIKVFIKWATSELLGLECSTPKPYNWLQSWDSSPCILYFFFAY